MAADLLHRDPVGEERTGERIEDVAPGDDHGLARLPAAGSLLHGGGSQSRILSERARTPALVGHGGFLVIRVPPLIEQVGDEGHVRALAHAARVLEDDGLLPFPGLYPVEPETERI